MSQGKKRTNKPKVDGGDKSILLSITIIRAMYNWTDNKTWTELGCKNILDYPVFWITTVHQSRAVFIKSGEVNWVSNYQYNPRLVKTYSVAVEQEQPLQASMCVVHHRHRHRPSNVYQVVPMKTVTHWVLYRFVMHDRQDAMQHTFLLDPTFHPYQYPIIPISGTTNITDHPEISYLSEYIRWQSRIEQHRSHLIATKFAIDWC